MKTTGTGQHEDQCKNLLCVFLLKAKNEKLLK